MGRMSAHLGREVSWEEAFDSGDSLTPTSLASMGAAPPTTPDKYGDYIIPAVPIGRPA